ncbi:glucoside xylosyltransferase 1-like [Dermacentor andersoni]|uniref:glucoside xylosyltransferase 1-like n=1 Tax=Dermacentor andersoni TaxID=34620 RepID=UPI002417C8AB|nr:glucoside xylosyltransferase 1-like [Dermacentor andersoni]
MTVRTSMEAMSYQLGKPQTHLVDALLFLCFPDTVQSPLLQGSSAMAIQRTVYLSSYLLVIAALTAVCLVLHDVPYLWRHAPYHFLKAAKSQNTLADRVKLVVVTCDSVLNLTLANIKSAVAFTAMPLELLLFTDEKNREALQQMISLWPESVLKRVHYKVSAVKFPEPDSKRWRGLFQPCSSQRLFLPSLLPDVDAVIYVDADVLFVSPIERLWQHFASMNSSHLAAMAPEGEEYASNWYRNSARHPFYQPLGVNSGVMLMNLTRMRKFGWEEHMRPLLEIYGENMPWGDQDLLNIFFGTHPELLLVFSCRWNYRTDHCMHGTYCTEGPPAVVHGSRNVFAQYSQPAFWELHQAMGEYELGESLGDTFIEVFKDRLSKSRNTSCGHEFLKHVVHWEKTARAIDNATNKTQQNRAQGLEKNLSRAM